MTDLHAGAVTKVDGVRLSPALTVEATDSLWDAWQLMFVSGLRHLVVVDGGGRCDGILTDRAILTDLPLSEEHLASHRVREVMSRTHAVRPGDSVHDAAEMMTRDAVEAAPVVDDDGRIRGMLTAVDVVRWIAAT